MHPIHLFLFCSLLLLGTTNCQSPKETPAEAPSAATSSTIYSPTQFNPLTTKRVPLYRSIDQGKTWQEASYNLPADVQVSFIERLGDEIVMATDNRGVFISTDERTNWIAVGEDLPNDKINSLFVFAETIYVGVYGDGLFMSTNQGQAWVSMTYNLPDQRVQSILRTEEAFFAGTDSGIFRLDEPQQQWLEVFPAVQVLSLEEQSETLIAGTSRGTLRSDDQGGSWQWVHQEGALHYTHWVGDHIVEMYVSGDLYLSEDKGDSWFKATYSPSVGSYVYEVIRVGDRWVLSNNYGIHQSMDAGRSWELIFPTEAMGFFDFLVMGNTLYGGTRAWDEYRKRTE